MTKKPPIYGTWAEDDIRRAFVAGAQWWEWETEGATMWPGDVTKAEAEARNRYGDDPNMPPSAYLAAIGKKGGSVSSQAKKDAAKRRNTKGRPKGAKDLRPRKNARTKRED